MMKIALSSAIALCLFCGAASAEDQADQTAARPDGSETEAVSDGLAECAAILAAASGRSKNFVERDSFRIAAAIWFARSDDLAVQEGGTSDAAVRDEKITKWSGQILSVGALNEQADWAAYCSDMAVRHGLDDAVFAQYIPPDTAEAEPEPAVE